MATAYASESSYLKAAIRRLISAGWELRGASNGERSSMIASVRDAVSFASECETGAIFLAHPTLGKLALQVLFQGGEPEEVIYDYACSAEAMKVIDSLIYA